MVSQLSQRAEGSLFSTRVISSHLKLLGYPQRSIDSMLKCGSYTGDIIFGNCNCKVDVIPLKHKCSLRTCSSCSKKRKRKFSKKYLPFLKNLAQDKKYFIYFLTISPQNYSTMEEGFSHLRKSFSKFLRHKYIKDRLKGGFYVIETKGKEGNYNIHLHILCYGRFLDNRIRGKCLDCGQNLIKYNYNGKNYFCASRTCNSSKVIFYQDSKLVSLFKQSSKRPCNVHISRQGSPQYSLNYMLKYISSNKDDFSSSLDIAKYIFLTRKRKLVNSFGCFFGVKFQKPVYFCQSCNSKIYFVFDISFVNCYLNSSSKPPPNQTIFK